VFPPNFEAFNTDHSLMSYEYIGKELLLFKEAINWKNYSFSQFTPFIKGDVLEVGAGIGTNTLLFSKRKDVTFDSWTATEIDAEQVKLLQHIEAQGELTAKHQVRQMYVSEAERQYDTLIYIDVLEHIENDAAELEAAFSALKPNGHLIVLCPAHNWLFSPFDHSIGHFRRYNKQMYLDIIPKGFEVLRMRYLDSVGILASATNKLFLRKPYPELAEVKFWDKNLVPISTMTDKLLWHLLGKSVLMIAKKKSLF
nr:class I SAM-dependent methyltransferase [Spirosomataceae bacterium]